MLLGATVLRAQTRRTHVVEHPENVAIVAGETAMEQKDYAKAETSLKEAIKIDPKNYRAWFDLGYVYNATDRTEEAIDAYRKSVAAQPGVIESTLNLGVLLASSGNSEAGKWLREAVKLKPNAAQQAAIKGSWMNLGRAIGERDRAGAIDSYQQASAMDTQDPLPHLELGELYLKVHSDAEAEPELKRALALDPKSSGALALLSDLYMRTGRLDDAAKTLRQFVQQQPQSANAHLQLGRILAAGKDYEGAIGEYEKALELSPADTDVLRELAASQTELKRDDAALATLKALSAKTPNDPQVHYALGRALIRKLDYHQALGEFLTAARLKPDFADAYGQAALAASDDKDYSLALKALDSRAKLVPETAGTIFLRATCLDHLRAFKDASVYYKKFLAESNGKFPEEEWKARHRLIAIDPELRKNNR